MKYLKNPAVGTIRHEQQNNTLVLTDHTTLKTEVLKPPLDYAYIGSLYSFFAYGKGGQYVFSPEYQFNHIETEGIIQFFKKPNKSLLGFEAYAAGTIQELYSLLILDGMQKPQVMRVAYVLSLGNVYRMELTGTSEKVFEDVTSSLGFRVSLRNSKGMPENNRLILEDEYILHFEKSPASESIRQTDVFKDCLYFLE